MWKLPLPEVETASDDLIRALTLMNDTPVYPITPQEQEEILQLYNSYDALLGQTDETLKAPLFSVALKDALHAAYSEVQEGRRLSSLRSRIKLAAARCPLCGIGPVTDLDHVLPRSKYKALSIYARNLVPACHTCNNKKRTLDGSNPNEQLVHSYFDDIPEEPFLVATASIVNGGLVVDFIIDQINGMSDAVYRRLSFQLQRLNLVARYNDEINTFLSSQETSIEDAFGEQEDAEGVRQFLLRSFTTHTRRFGRNDWRTALLESLSTCDEFCTGGFRRALGTI